MNPQDLYPTTPTAQCELCKRIDAVGNLDWISRDFDKVRVIVYGHIPGAGCNQEPERPA
jgi:hypothetical protein